MFFWFSKICWGSFQQTSWCFRQQARVCKVSPCGDLLWKGQTPDQKSVGRAKPFGDSYFPKLLNGAGSKKNLLSLKAANSHLWWSGVALVVFMIVWWLNRLPVISCSNSAHKGPDQKCGQCRFLNGWANFSKGMESKSIFFYPNISGRTFFCWSIYPLGYFQWLLPHLVIPIRYV